jgi:hypothetical protein
VALRVYSNNASAQGAVIRGAANQLEDLTEWQNSSATVLGGRNANAQIFTGSTAPIQTVVGTSVTATTGNGTTATITTQFNHNLLVGERITVAGVNPSGYNGTFIVTAVPTTTQLSYANTTTAAWVSGGTVSVDNQASITLRSPGTTGLAIRANSYASGQLTQWLSPAGVVQAGVTGSGRIFTGTGALTNSGGQAANISALADGATITPLVVRGAASASANLVEVQNSAGAIQCLISPFGAVTFGTGTILGRVSVSTGSTGTIGAVIRGVSGQTANLQEWQSDAGSIVARVDSVGDITARVARSTFAARFVTTDPSIAIQVNTGAASQTGDFFQTQTSTGTVMQRLTSAGLIRAADNVIANALVGASGSADTTVTTSLVRIQANSTLGGGWLQATRLTSAPGSITADSGQVYFRTGTNPNTLKLVVKAGAGAEQTIIDNIPTT